MCYDESNRYLLISLRGVYYHYCDIGSDVVSRLLAAESMSRYFNAEIKGQFDCRTGHVPVYERR